MQTPTRHEDLRDTLTMGGDSGDDVLEREFMPSVDAFFGEEPESTTLNVMSLSRADSELVFERRPFHDAVPRHKTESRDELDSAKAVHEFHADSCSSMKSGCLDPPPEENRASSLESADTLTSTVEQLTERCDRLEVVNGLLRKKLKAKGSDGDSELQKWLQLPSLGGLERRETFSDLHRTWESQRDILFDRLREKDEVIRRQNDLLLENSKAVNQMAAGVDGLEARFSRQIESHKLKLAELEQNAHEKIDSLTAVHEEIEKRQRQTHTAIAKLSTSRAEDIASLEKALQRRTALYTQSEMEKQVVIKNLDASEEERAVMKSEVVRLGEELSVEKVKNLKLQQVVGDGPRSCKEIDASPAAEHIDTEDSSALVSKREGSSVDAVKKENFQLKREMLEMEEKLVDLKEHCDELESRVSEQQQAFHQSRSQIQELEFLKRTKQDLIAILTAKQRTINGLKQSLSSLRSEMKQAPEALASAENRFLEEILAAQKRCEELESLFINAQSERDRCKCEIFRLTEVMNSMCHEAQRQKRASAKLKREHAALLKTSNCQRSEIATLQTNLRVQALQMTSCPPKTMQNKGEVDLDVMKELLKSKLAAAEMTELVAQLRHELTSVRQKNKAKKRSMKHGYHHLLLKTLTGILAPR